MHMRSLPACLPTRCGRGCSHGRSLLSSWPPVFSFDLRLHQQIRPCRNSNFQYLVSNPYSITTAKVSNCPRTGGGLHLLADPTAEDRGGFIFEASIVGMLSQSL